MLASKVAVFLELHERRLQLAERVRELEQALLERQRAEEALHEADRRKSEFLAMLSHELRNPLAPIKNSLYILERTPPGSEPARRAQAVIDRQVEQLARLVDDLLDVTRVTRNRIQLQRTRLDLGDLVRRTVEDQRSVFEQTRRAARAGAAARAGRGGRATRPGSPRCSATCCRTRRSSRRKAG